VTFVHWCQLIFSSKCPSDRSELGNCVVSRVNNNLINSRRIRNCSNATRCANGLTRGRAQPTSRDLSVPVFTSRSAAADRQSRRLHQSAAFPHPKLCKFARRLTQLDCRFVNDFRRAALARPNAPRISR
jgi:hypothetical protein